MHTFPQYRKSSPDTEKQEESLLSQSQLQKLGHCHQTENTCSHCTAQWGCVSSVLAELTFGHWFMPSSPTRKSAEQTKRPSQTKRTNKYSAVKSSWAGIAGSLGCLEVHWIVPKRRISLSSFSLPPSKTCVSRPSKTLNKKDTRKLQLH